MEHHLHQGIWVTTAGGDGTKPYHHSRRRWSCESRISHAKEAKVGLSLELLQRVRSKIAFLVLGVRAPRLESLTAFSECS